MSDSDAGLLKIKHSSLELTTKPGASIHYSYIKGPYSESAHLIVFLNGLMTDKTSWLAIMSKVSQAMPSHPTMLAYDRYGQGLTEDRDPQDKDREEGYGHDAQDVTRDLHQLILQFVEEHLYAPQGPPHIILVAASIGCAIARLYAQEHPGSVAGLLLLDSIMANSNFDFWPDPDAPGFDPSSLPEDITPNVLREQRTAFAARFSPKAVNREGFDRRNLASLLPYSDAPKLQGPGDKGPYVLVVGHDPETFAEESLEVSRYPTLRQVPSFEWSQLNISKKMGTPISLSMTYTNPLWHEYNEGLVRLTAFERGIGPHIAPLVSHVIQHNVLFVVRSVVTLIYFVCEVG